MSTTSFHNLEQERKKRAICERLNKTIETAETVAEFVESLEEHDDFHISVYIRLNEYYSNSCRQAIEDIQNLNKAVIDDNE